MTDLVLDASVALAWCFDDEDPTALAILDLAGSGVFQVPSVWPFEIGNGLAVAERRRRLGQADAARFLALLAALEIEVDATPWPSRLPSLLGLARAHGISLYDAAYLDLAQRSGLPLATLDDSLAQAARAVGVAIAGGGR
ncbi:MAG: type II toxin-antitoxin system VapC family toxin [Thermoanaerobaculia bacterium]